MVGSQVDVDPRLASIKMELVADLEAWPWYSLVQGRLLYK